MNPIPQIIAEKLSANKEDATNTDDTGQPEDA